MREVPVKFRRPGPGVDDARGPATACHAPTAQLHFSPNGEVRSCCVNSRPLGSIVRSTLRDIWDGVRRSELRARLALHDYSGGCEGCGASIEVEGRSGSYPEIFDEWAPAPAEPTGGPWPARMEFNLSNSCNLQCVQCDGELSSAIRIHREGRSSLPRVYGDEFFEQLSEFLPHLEYAQFAGGEPFLGAENFRAWDLIAEVNPTLPCYVVTNATQWTPRVRATVERLRMGFTFSLDGITPGTYESIRVGSSFAEVMENIDHLSAMARDNDMPVAVNHCLMPQNHHEFGDLLLWAERRSMPVNVSVVRTPAHSSIAHLPSVAIERVHERLLLDAERVGPLLELNQSTLQAELVRIGRWAHADLRGSTRAWAAPRYGRILEFPTDGRGPCDDAAAFADLQRFAVDGRAYRFTVGPDNRITHVDAAVARLDWLQPGELIGQPAATLQERFEQHHGTLRRQEVLHHDDDRMDLVSELGGATVRTAMVPLRDVDGWAQEASLIMAFGGS